jgi:prophage regulatory protein
VIPDKILRLPALMAQIGKSRSAIYLDISKGLFPRPVPIGRRSVGWLQSDVTNWISQRIEQSQKCSNNDKKGA